MEKKSKTSLSSRLLDNKWSIWTVLSLVNEVVLTPVNGPLQSALIQPIWFLRSDDTTMKQDVLITLLIGSYRNGLQKPDWVLFPLLGFLHRWGRSRLGHLDWIVGNRVMEFQIFSILILLMIFAGAIVLRGEAPPSKAKVVEKETDEEYLLPPLLLPGKTTHTRLFPQKHSFDYSYFSVGVPVGFKGRASSVLSSNLDLLEPCERRRGWFNVNASDYLYRGGSEKGLKERLQHFLRGEGVSDDSWSFAYLVTAPRFLGYSFNPVSFWYIYDNDKELSMMILEVNNTFGERRLYLLKAQGSVDEDSSAPDGEQAPAKAIKFTNAWEKDFHVSPFNSRKGTYSLTATDPLTTLRTDDGKFLDNLIVLNSSKAHAKLVARVFSEGSPKDPFKISTIELAKILGAWFWVGFATFPRILTQAWILYFKRGLNVWFKPEILSSSIGRAHTSSEKVLETFFQSYITSLVKKSVSPLRVTYIPPGSLGTPVTITSDSTTTTTEPKDLELMILTPAFYSRFVHYSHTKEAFDREGLCAEEKNRTISITKPQHLSLLLHTQSSVTRPDRWIEKQRWNVLWRLRCPAPATAYPVPVDPNMTVKDIRTTPPSELDRFVLASAHSGLYCRTLTKLFIAQRLFLGFDGAVGLLDLGFRFGIVLLSFELAGLGRGMMVRRLGRLGLVTGVHVWAWLKGTC